MSDTDRTMTCRECGHTSTGVDLLEATQLRDQHDHDTHGGATP